MTKPKSRKKEVDPSLAKAIKDLMVEVMKQHEGEGQPKYSLTDKMKVMDRFIKIEQIRLDVQEDDGGSFFKNQGGQNADE